jgi:pimeloyl-ACP methyl ester carboxylesterase
VTGPVRAAVDGIELAYETVGDPADPPVVLIMGLGAQLNYWHEGFVGELAGRGTYVITFDNRDVGLSSHFPDAGPVNLATLAGDSPPPYTLSDLAGDVAGLIAALQFDSAHIVGISSGGMIAQQTAIDFPDRVRSLVSIAASTGNRNAGGARSEVLAALFSPPPEATRDAVGNHALQLSRLLGSTGFDLDENWLKERAQTAFDRCYDPDGVMRQAAAIASSRDRTDRLRQLRMPALVIHGAADPVITTTGAEAMAEAIPKAELLVIDGMGHDLPRGVWPTVLDAIARTIRRGEQRLVAERDG